MRGRRCWARLPDGTRCAQPSVHGGHFCEKHWMGYQPDPALIFLAPLAEMPNDLVQYLRAVAPGTVYPQPLQPADLALPVSAPTSSPAPPEDDSFAMPTARGAAAPSDQ